MAGCEPASIVGDVSAVSSAACRKRLPELGSAFAARLPPMSKYEIFGIVRETRPPRSTTTITAEAAGAVVGFLCRASNDGQRKRLVSTHQRHAWRNSFPGPYPLPMDENQQGKNSQSRPGHSGKRTYSRQVRLAIIKIIRALTILNANGPGDFLTRAKRTAKRAVPRRYFGVLRPASRYRA
ncbi:hypothetical protein KCP76_14535 [Salmonella enterica subsp. enterica serovar Weltevreden]|nr:hypothetical protein KCP76_14535 [Salmonella enterica subsp. enterica serovar Weltevreden]